MMPAASLELTLRKEPRSLEGLAAKLPALFVAHERTGERFFGFFTAHLRKPQHAVGLLQGGVPVFRLVRGQASRWGLGSQSDILND